MILLVAGSAKRCPAALKQHVGDFIQPQRWGHVAQTRMWAADNDCFSGFNEDRYRRMLDRIVTAVTRWDCTPPQFVTLPDVVGNHDATLQLWGHWHRHLGERNLNRAFVLQNGAERHGWKGIPWDYIEALFIGGDTDFKLSRFARDMAAVGRWMGKWIHMGRVNGLRRLRYAVDIGCHSCDGSSMGRFAEDKLIPMAASLNQLTLFNAL